MTEDHEVASFRGATTIQCLFLLSGCRYETDDERDWTLHCTGEHIKDVEQLNPVTCALCKNVTIDNTDARTLVEQLLYHSRNEHRICQKIHQCIPTGQQMLSLAKEKHPVQFQANQNMGSNEQNINLDDEYFKPPLYVCANHLQFTC